MYVGITYKYMVTTKIAELQTKINGLKEWPKMALNGLK